VLSTAHPAKFPDAVKAACGVVPALPDWLAIYRSGRSASPCCRRIRRRWNDTWRRPHVPRVKEQRHDC
jgi:threonine synthase